ncbi:MAG: transposase [Spartobacteria bacterium]|nr:transposase [Spartobacteria bacterium]
MRRRRIKRDGLAYYHLINRMTMRLMLLGDEEKEVLRRLIRRVEGFTGVRVLTYALMTNHIHILVEEPDEGTVVGDDELLVRLQCLYGKVGLQEILERWELWEGRGEWDVVEEDKALYRRRMHDISEFMKQIKQRFTCWYHRTHGTKGGLWQDRFKSVLVEDGAALRTMAAYIEMNPVRAGLVDDPKAYRFCGFGEAMGGNQWARQGIECIARSICESGGWGSVSETYFEHILMYEEVRNNRNLVYMDQDMLREKIKSRVKLTEFERLMCRCRYFTHGQVVGSRDFVEAFFAENRDYFGPRRRQGRKRVRDGLGDLYAIREVWSGG